MKIDKDGKAWTVGGIRAPHEDRLRPYRPAGRNRNGVLVDFDSLTETEILANFGLPPLDALQKEKRMNKKELLEAAIKTVADRGVPYGGVEDNFTRIARLWKMHLLNRFDRAPDLTPADVAMMMVLMKIARLENQPNHPDSWTDVAGYAACGADITSDAPTN